MSLNYLAQGLNLKLPYHRNSKRLMKVGGQWPKLFDNVSKDKDIIPNVNK